MAHYLIEFRFHGYAKRYSRSLIYEVARKFRVSGVTKKRAVPHITLFGPFTTRNERKIVSEVVNIGRKHFLVPFKVKGFNSFDNNINKVIYIDIEPSQEMGELRWEIARRLLKITKTKSVHDAKRDFHFHATIAFRDIDRKFSEILKYLKSKEEPNVNQHLLRITILKNGKILNEYDLIQKRLLSRRQAKSRHLFNQTINLFRNQNEKFRKEIEIERNFWDRIKSIFKVQS